MSSTLTRGTVALLIGAAAVLVALPHFQMERPSPAPQLDDPDRTRLAIAEVHAQISALNRDVAQLRDELAVLRVATTLAAGSTAQDRSDVGDASSDEQLWRAQLERRVRTERADASSRSTAARLRRELAGSLPRRALLRSAECTIRLCKVEMSFPDVDSWNAFLEERFAGNDVSLWDGPMGFVLETDPAGAEVLAIAYLGRDATALNSGES